MENIVLIVIILAIVASAVFYIYRSKKSGQKCIGCPYAKSCQSNCNCSETKN